MEKKKVLVFASTFPRWKDDTNPPFVYELSKRLTKYFDIVVLTPYYPGSKKYEEMDGMKVYRFKYFLEKYQKLAGSGGILPTIKKNKWYIFQVPFFLLGEFLALRKIVKKENPDIIHSHWILPQGFISYLNYKISRTPYIVTTWGGDMFVFKKKGAVSALLRKIYSKVLNNSKNSTSVNMVFLDEMKSVTQNKEKIRYIPNGVDSKLFTPEKKDNSLRKKYGITGPFLLFIGRITEKKGISYLIEAMPEVKKQIPNAKLMIIGSGELEDSLKQLSSNLNVSNSIIFTGPITNKELPKYYASADLFIAPSITTKDGDREGFPTVFLESMSSGTPVLTTKIDGIKEIIIEGKNGFLVDQKSSSQLADSIISLIKSKSKLSSTESFSRSLALKSYDWNIIAKQYAEVLR